MPCHPQGGRFRLLVDLLEHEVAEAALVGHVLRAGEQGGGALHPPTCGVIELNAEGSEQSHLAVLHGQDRAGEARQGRGVAGAEELPFPKTDQQRSRLAGHHQGSGGLSPHHRQGIGPMQPRQNRLEPLQQQRSTGQAASGHQPRQLAAEQVGDHLGVRVRAEHHPLRLQFLAQAAEVFDDAVLHHRQPAGVIQMRVGVALLRLAVGGPACVADAALACSTGGLKPAGEVHQLAFRLEATELAGHVHRGNASGVVAAVFELPQALQQQGGCFAGSDQGNDAAHTAWCLQKSPAWAGLELMGGTPKLSKPDPWSEWSRRPGRREWRGSQ